MDIPPRVEYSLTYNGKELIPVLKALTHWCEKMKKEEVRNNIM